MPDVTQDVAPEVSMDDFMGQAFDKLETDESPAAEPAPEVDSDDTPTDQKLSGPEKDTPDVDTDEHEDKAEPEETPTVTPPQSMSAKDREAFYALPPEQQKWISDRAKEQESAFTKKTMELAEQRKSFDKLEQIIAPRRQQLAMNGMDEGTAIGQLFALSDFANENPVGFVRYLLNERGIPLTALTQSGEGNHAAADPQLTAMQREIHGLKDHFTQMTQAQQANSVASDIKSFSSDPAYPYYSELESDMIPLVAGFRQSNPGLSNREYLAKAYKAAVAVNEEVAAKISVDENAKRIAEAKKAADKAKKAGSTNIKTRGTLPPGATKAKSVDDFIGALVDERMVG